MNILIISNMYPSEQKPYSGLFVVNQVDAIKDKLNNEDIIDFYYMKRTFTNKIGSIVKYVKFFINFIFFIKKKNIKYDIVHIHYYFPTIYLGLLYKFFFNRNVKIVVTFHGGDFNNRKHNFLYTYPLKKINLIISVSSELKNKIQNISNFNNIIVISAGINNIFSKSEKYNLINKKYDLIFVGSFYPIKGFDIFCQFLLQYNKKLSICIVGSGKLEYLLKEYKLYEKHNINLFNNLNQEELVIKYNLSKYLINTSRKEGFGLVMSEAMACGLPVIASFTDGSREQIKDSYNGFLINENETIFIKKLSKKLNNILQIDKLEYKQLSHNAIKYAETQKLSHISIKLIKLYRSLINE